ncbi:hypothetical protein R3P38DRAFT_2816424 [Favolaschia claudopus]|uniref:Uncharacterized protein n=1 Tax=Favolaschia claudopus TaxID=2862362 RepID=A0AAV9YZ93_9AGAR
MGIVTPLLRLFFSRYVGIHRLPTTHSPRHEYDRIGAFRPRRMYVEGFANHPRRHSLPHIRLPFCQRPRSILGARGDGRPLKCASKLFIYLVFYARSRRADAVFNALIDADTDRLTRRILAHTDAPTHTHPRSSPRSHSQDQITIYPPLPSAHQPHARRPATSLSALTPNSKSYPRATRFSRSVSVSQTHSHHIAESTNASASNTLRRSTRKRRINPSIPSPSPSDLITPRASHLTGSPFQPAQYTANHVHWLPTSPPDSPLSPLFILPSAAAGAASERGGVRGFQFVRVVWVGAKSVERATRRWSGMGVSRPVEEGWGENCEEQVHRWIARVDKHGRRGEGGSDYHILERVGLQSEAGRTQAARASMYEESRPDGGLERELSWRSHVALSWCEHLLAASTRSKM